MILGGLFSKKALPALNELIIPKSFTYCEYRSNFQSFGWNESYLVKYLSNMLEKELGWEDVTKRHDIWLSHNCDKMFIECKKYDPKYLYLEDYRGGSKEENAQDQVIRYFKEYPDFKWGILTDGATFRLYYNSEDPTFEDLFLEISLEDIINSTDRNPYELQLLIDILSPNSLLRSLNPEERFGLSEKYQRKIVEFIKKNPKRLKTTLKSLCVAALEDMGIRPLHHRDIKSIRSASRLSEFQKIFSSVDSKDPDFHTGKEYIEEDLCKGINALFQEMDSVDFYHIDHEFFGLIYQKIINNGNASHYTNTKLSKEMANYIANRSEKSQKSVQITGLSDNDYILDPALGSGQLLRSLLPFHKVFFGNTKKGILGWRELGKHFIGRDIDEDAIWIAKINLWLSTSEKGKPFINLSNFRKSDVIKATINRRAGQTIKEAFEIDPKKNIVGCISNPPWDAFRNDKRRGITYDRTEVEQIKKSLDLYPRQLNRAQIFMNIIHRIGKEEHTMRYSVILPDSIFVDQNNGLRDLLRTSLDFYFSYPRNIDPNTNKRIFNHVDNTRKFGILFGRSNTSFSNVVCYPFGNDEKITLSDELDTLGDLKIFPLFSHTLQEKIVKNWKAIATRAVDWKEGEYHQTNWLEKQGRKEANNGQHYVVSGTSICDKNSAIGIYPINKTKYWKRMKTIPESDKKLSQSGRAVFLDYMNNSNKLNVASYIDKDTRVNITNKLLYSHECKKNDWLVYDSAVFSTFIEIYGTSQNINAFRLTHLRLPKPLESISWLEANAELMEMLSFNLEEANKLFEINKDWIQRTFSRAEWLEATGSRVATEKEIRDLIDEIENLESEAIGHEG